MSFIINSVTIVGCNLVRDAELKHFSSGNAQASFDIAVNNSYNKKDTGEKVDEVSYFKCILWGKRAESLIDFLKKGKKIAVDGRIQQRRWSAEDGTARSVVEIVVSQVVLMSVKIGAEPKAEAPTTAPSAPTTAVQKEIDTGIVKDGLTSMDTPF